MGTLELIVVTRGGEARIRTKTSSLASATYHLKRAILEHVLESNYTTRDRERVLQYFGGCAYCGAAKSRATRNDHLVPVYDRGDFVPSNVVPACARCDDSKGKLEFRKWMLESESAGSLLRRGHSRTEIAERIKRIERWRRGYRPPTEEQVFGRHLPRFVSIQRKAVRLTKEAGQLVGDVRAERQKRPTRRPANPVRSAP